MLSCLKKAVFPLLYPYDIRRHSLAKNQVRTRKFTHARSPIVCVRYVGDYEMSLNDRSTTGSTKSIRSSSFSSFLHDCTQEPSHKLAGKNSSIPTEKAHGRPRHTQSKSSKYVVISLCTNPKYRSLILWRHSSTWILHVVSCRCQISLTYIRIKAIVNVLCSWVYCTKVIARIVDSWSDIWILYQEFEISTLSLPKDTQRTQEEI